MPFSTVAKNGMLDSRVCDAIRLHSGAPGASGTSNALGEGISAAVFDAASAGARALASDVLVTGLAANQSVTHFSVWQTAGAVFQGSGTISAGDTQANASGEFSLEAGTSLALNDA